jgi:hypothetical protein
VVRRSIADQAGIAADAPELDRLRDAYLEPFEDLAPRPQLEHELRLAEYVDGVARAESWRRALTDASAEEVAQFQDPVAEWLTELIDAPDPR